ncbi:MAG: 4-hydroxy-tetrahydrodipicolinate synthase [Candidatus Margulisbacteria bacterium GWF2_35_9]|nr:MAG: 4-hydroxy-tetrahydrodipicolinate synthase [Candidatus Margulisbacteria bacterium GWF2_35_9]
MTEFGRIMTAMITPFDKKGEINFKEVKRLALKLVNEGTETIVVTGTTGESPTLSHEEDLLLYATVLDAIGDKAKVVAGTGSNCTKTTIKYTRMAQAIGVHGAMIVVPYYNKPSQDGMYQHFSQVAENTDLPLMIYNIPGRTGVNMLPETVIRITERCRNYISIKEASGNLEQMAQIIKLNKRKDFKLYSGDDALTLDVIKLGGVGVVSVASHIVGNDIKEMINLYIKGDVAGADALNKKLMPIFKVLFITSNPAPTKDALNMLGYQAGSPRLPIVAVNKEESAQIKSVLKDLKLI